MPGAHDRVTEGQNRDQPRAKEDVCIYICYVRLLFIVLTRVSVCFQSMAERLDLDRNENAEAEVEDTNDSVQSESEAPSDDEDDEEEDDMYVS